MPVRGATPADLDDIAGMTVELATFERSAHEVGFDREELATHLFGPEPAAHVLIASVDEGKGSPPAGMARWYPTFSTWVGRPGVWLEDLIVRPPYRRRGLGAERVSGWIRYRWKPATSD